MDAATIPPPFRAPELVAICKRFGVERLDLFGSAGTADFVPGRSDIDLIVRFAPGAGDESLGTRFVGLADALESLLGTRVDLMSDHSIANPYLRNSIDATRRVVHDESTAQASV